MEWVNIGLRRHTELYFVENASLSVQQYLGKILPPLLQKLWKNY